MVYNLDLKTDRKRFVTRCNILLRKHCQSVNLSDESVRTRNQNCYAHVLFRILAMETGVTEEYAKEVYFKQLANPGTFIRTEENPVTGQEVTYLRSSKELTIVEMSHAIDRLRTWSEDNGIYLPDAKVKEDGSIEFSTPEDEQAYYQAISETSKVEQYINK